MTEEIKLKPCPFCGSEAVMLGEDDGMYQVICPECNGTIDDFYNEKEVAAEKWNSRPIEDDLNEQIGRFKKYAAALEKEVKNLRAALETILDASQKDDACVLGISVVAYEALKEDKHSD